MGVDAEILRAVPLFRGLTDRVMNAITEMAEEVTYAPGEVMVREGEAGDACYLVLDGTASVSRAGADSGVLGSGSLIGEIALVDGRARTATVAAMSRARAVVIRRDGFDRLMEAFPSVRLGILMNATERAGHDRDAGPA